MPSGGRILRRHVVRAALVLAFLSGTTLAFALSEGPVASRTGAFSVAGKSAEPSCTVCHTKNAQGIPPGINDPSGSLHILGVPPRYTPGDTYSLTVRLAHTWNPLPPDPIRWGFQLQAVSAATGDGAGAWVLGANAPPDTFLIRNGLSTTVWKNRVYIEHTRNQLTDVGSNHVGEAGPIDWHLTWIAPPSDIGTIYFFAAGNSANGDLQSLGSGDFIFTTADSSLGPSPLAIPIAQPPALANALEAPFPNPMVKCTDITFTIARAGMVDLAVYDLQGRRIASILHERKDAGSYGSQWSGRRADGSFAPNGLYFIRLLAPGARGPLTQKVTLAR